MTATLLSSIAAWDGKDRAAIDAIYKAHRSDVDFIATLLTLCSSPNTERGASWLLKAHLEEGTFLDNIQHERFYQALLNTQHWETRLHLLQVLHCVPLPESQHLEVYHWLTHRLQDPNKFIRAWTYHGLEHTARWYPEHRDEVDAFIALAMTDEAPSVKARLRRLTKSR